MLKEERRSRDVDHGEGSQGVLSLAPPFLCRTHTHTEINTPCTDDPWNCFSHRNNRSYSNYNHTCVWLAPGRSFSDLKAIKLLKISPSACSLITKLFPITLQKEKVHLVVIVWREGVYTQSSAHHASVVNSLWCFERRILQRLPPLWTKGQTAAAASTLVSALPDLEEANVVRASGRSVTLHWRTCGEQNSLLSILVCEMGASCLWWMELFGRKRKGWSSHKFLRSYQICPMDFLFSMGGTERPKQQIGANILLTGCKTERLSVAIVYFYWCILWI